MQVIDHLKKPEYLFRPSQLLIRIQHELKGKHRYETVRLPWGLTIKIQPDDIVGRALWTVGLVDPTVSEVLWRLIEPQETVVDVGANIGYMTGLMATRVERSGKVISFEPNPDLFALLSENAAHWQNELGTPIALHQLALSDHCGAGRFGIPAVQAQDWTLAGLLDDATRAHSTFSVEVRRLDEYIPGPIGVLKIDVEGHELKVLQGAGALLRERLIRDIVFEEHAGYPTPVTELLEAAGYPLFNLGQTLFGLKLTPIAAKSHHRAWDSRSCLATLDPQRALARLRKRGWEILRRRASLRKRSQ
jgi:FkbM family methyltransferase